MPRRGYQLIAEVEFEEAAERAEPRYRIQRKLGRGAMGEVYLAEDTFLRRRVALKFLLAEMEEDGHWHRRMFREAQAAAALDHPFFCKIYDVGRMGGRSFIAMEYVEGETLRQRLAKGPLPLRQAVQRKALPSVSQSIERSRDQAGVGLSQFRSQPARRWKA